MITLTRVILFAILVSISSCASIPKETAMLSEGLGNKLSLLEQSHLNLLHLFFKEKRDIINKFITEEWMPAFAEEFFKNPKIDSAWDEIVQSGNKDDRLKFILLTGSNIQKKINEKRMELITPLDNIEKELENKIRDEYNAARAINNTLTSFLYSASKVEENRERFMGMFGIKTDEVNDVLNETDNIVNKLVNIGDSIKEKEGLAEKYLEAIKNIKEKLSE